jgi:hypothetical protein
MVAEDNDTRGRWLSPAVAARLVGKPARSIRYWAMNGTITARQNWNGYWEVLVLGDDPGGSGARLEAPWKKPGKRGNSLPRNVPV